MTKSNTNEYKCCQVQFVMMTSDNWKKQKTHFMTRLLTCFVTTVHLFSVEVIKPGEKLIQLVRYFEVRLNHY